MKKTRKRCLGFAGLSLVAAMTVVAANMPTPGAFATSSVVDTIKVRVVGGGADVNIVDITDGSVYTDPSDTFGVDYENLDGLTITSTYTDDEGNVQEKTVVDTTYDQGIGTLDLSLSDVLFGNLAYGKYVIKASGLGYDGVYDEDSISFYYVPFTAKAEVDETTGKHYAVLDYNTTVGDETERPASFTFDIYDEDGNLVDKIPQITALSPETKVEIPFAKYDMPSGTYKVTVTAYDIDGNKMYKSVDLTIVYKASVVPDAGAPDTGGLFQNLNISSEDYLISGLILFFVLGIVAFGVIARSKKNNQKRRR